ncbi:methyltransferase domain-containing protein [Conexibacter sp. JD483]|uniref:methyltransferase domain-containing protein n=1 Tax=unclassified Conexibacter TaxID=2627773 RepID=UPI002715F98B|nr:MULTISPECIES: methyltransferase domain-containing protein [unclassified Conexibacter]MDO8184072.1 methyltransferase domain-containing protein [Conexibacter sp. CPCC 205706]MDO8197064.1 methyltransferase domain-containing protein [Conexibacter sp. CPCC 205762]MDR9367980.1 methyltransferase domain-containing protein [Conexibacter sp. JD483]
MPDWQERITADSRPATRAEHELRYALAAPLIRAAARWCDLGCGAGVAAAAALGDEPYGGSALLIDRDAAVADAAAAAVQAREATALALDLADGDALATLRSTLAGDEPLVITCFETIEHLSDFAPLVTLLTELAARPATTVLLSVPNDDFWAIENPHHATLWGEGALSELRSLLPAGHVALRQVALQGTALLPLDGEARASASVALAPGVASHLLLAFGAEAAKLGPALPATRVVQADVVEQRRWERQRESDLLYHVAALRALEARLAETEAALAQATAAAAAPTAGEDDDAPAASGHA